MPKLKPTKIPQLRRCQGCDKVGHNRSTCPQNKISPAVQTQPSSEKPLATSANKISSQAPSSPLRFFVHHVNVAPPQSPHFLNLKTPAQTVWKNVSPTAPLKSNKPQYHYYHEQGRAVVPPTPSTPPPLINKKDETNSDEVVFVNSPDIRELIEPNKPSHTSPPIIPVTPPASIEPAPEPTITFIEEKESSLTTVVTAFKKQSIATATAVKKTTRSIIKAPQIFARNLTTAFTHHASTLNTHLTNSFNRAAETIEQTLETSGKNLRRLAQPKLGVAIFGVAVFAFLVWKAPPAWNNYYHDLLSTKQVLAATGQSGFSNLKNSTTALAHADVTGAEESTLQALQHFNTALDILEHKHRFLQAAVRAIPGAGRALESRTKLLLAGQEITVGNAYLLEGLKRAKAPELDSLTARLTVILGYLESALPNYEKALVSLQEVRVEDLPAEYRPQFAEFKLLFTATISDFKHIHELGDTLQEILGGNGRRRYLIQLQNEDEQRATGGFMGTFIFLEVKDGSIARIDIPPGGTYDLQGQIREYLEPPLPLLLVNDLWKPHDANWHFDFPESARRFMRFYEETRGMSVDGVFAVNHSFLTRLLTLIGPLTDEKRNLTLTAENAIPLLQTVVETGPEKKISKPKQIISDLTPVLFDQLSHLSTEQLIPFLLQLHEALDQKEIQTYFTDARAEETVRSFGWSGNIVSTTPFQDYLAVVNTNINGGKSDARIAQKITHQAVVQPNGEIIVTLLITREHKGRADEQFYGQPNFDYLRVYVPQGSELLDTQGFTWPDEKNFHVPKNWTKKDTRLSEVEQEVGVDPKSGTRITNEFGKTVFANWVTTEPETTSQVEIVYRLPFKAFSTETPAEGWKKVLLGNAETSRYQLVLQRQSGTRSTFESQIIFPSDWTPLWSDGPYSEPAENGLLITSSPLKKDSVWSVVLKKKPSP